MVLSPPRKPKPCMTTGGEASGGGGGASTTGAETASATAGARLMLLLLLLRLLLLRLLRVLCVGAGMAYAYEASEYSCAVAANQIHTTPVVE